MLFCWVLSLAQMLSVIMFSVIVTLSATMLCVIKAYTEWQYVRLYWVTICTLILSDHMYAYTEWQYVLLYWDKICTLILSDNMLCYLARYYYAACFHMIVVNLHVVLLSATVHSVIFLSMFTISGIMLWHHAK